MTECAELVLSPAEDKLQHEMYLNAGANDMAIKLMMDKLQHEMYLNSVKRRRNGSGTIDKLQHEMYLNLTGKVFLAVFTG